MFITPLIEIWRFSFPRNLRFCRQCQILHAQLAVVDKRYKDRKFIPRAELANVIESYVPGPPVPFVHLPVLRQLFLVRGINAIRIYYGYPAWLFTGAIRVEHAKIEQWFGKNGNTLWINRTRFKTEVLDEFHVAQQFHKFFLLGVFFMFLLMGVSIAGAFSEPLLYAYLVYVRRMDRDQVAAYIASVLEQHATTELTDAYKGALPPAAFTKPGRGDTVFFNIVEMTSPDSQARVVFVPYPKIAPEAFYRKAGNVLRNCAALLMEEVPLEQLHRMPPAYFFFLDGRENSMFPSLDLHHRIYDVIDVAGKVEPPKLLPGALRHNVANKYTLGVTPFSIKMLYAPYFLSGGKSDAKIAWATLKTIMKGEGLFPTYVDDILDAESAAAQDAALARSGDDKGIADLTSTAAVSPVPDGGAGGAANVRDKAGIKRQVRRVNLVTESAPEVDPAMPNLLTAERRIYASVAIPWTVGQISNLECSLFRAGWRVTNTSSIEWLSPTKVGGAFYDYYAGTGAVVSAAAASPAAATASR